MIKLLKYMTKFQWLQFCLIVACVFFDAFFVIKLPESMAVIITQVRISAPVIEIVKTGLVMLLYAICSLLCVVLAGYFSARVSASLCKNIRSKI